MASSSTIGMALFVLATAAAADDAPQDLPKLQSRDAWTYRQTVERPGRKPEVNLPQFSVLYIARDGSAPIQVLDGDAGKIVRLGPNAIGRVHFWVPQSACLFDPLNGGGMLTRKSPCPYPLKPDMTWREEEVIGGVRANYTFRVAGPEAVTVPAGRFEAFKVVQLPTPADAQEGAAATGPAAPGGRRMTSWYAPKAKAVVKSVVEFVDGSGAVSEKLSNELAVYEVHPPAGPGRP